MNDNLKIIAEFVDNASAGIKKAAVNMSEFTKGLLEGAKAEYQLIKAERERAAAMNAGGGGAANLVGQFKQLAIVVAAVTATIAGFVDAIRTADKLDDLAEKTGTTAANLKDLSYAATIGGSSLEGLLGAMNKLGKAADKSEEESSLQAKTFAQLGVSAEDATGKLKSSEELFLDLADAFKGIEDGPEKSAAAFRLFGGEAKNLLPLLNKGSEGIKALKEESAQLGGMSAEGFNAFAASSGDLFDNIDKLGVVSKGFFSTLSAELLPVINVMLEAFINSAKEGGLLRQVMNGLIEVFKFLIPYVKAGAEIFSGFISAVQIAGKSIGAVIAAIAVVANGGSIADLRAVWNDYKSDVQGVAQAHVDFTAKINGTNHEAVKLADGIEKPKRQIKSLTKATKEAKSALEEMVKGLRATVSSGGDEFLKQLTEANQKYQEDIKKGLNPAREKQLLAEATALIAQSRALKQAAEEQTAFDAARASLSDQADQNSILEYEATLVGKNADERERLLDKFRDEIALRKVIAGLADTDAKNIADQTRAANDRGAAAKAALEDSKVANEFIDNSIKAAEDAYKKRTEILFQLFAQGKIGLQDFNKFLEQENDTLLKKTQDTSDKSLIFWQEAAKGIQDALSTFFFDAMQGKLSNLGDSFKQLLDRMVANALAAKLAEALFGGQFEKGGKLGGLAGSAASFFGSYFGGGRALGGPVNAGMAYKINENTPRSEWFLPQTNGTVITDAQMNSQSGMSVGVTIHAVDSQSFLNQATKVERELQRMLSNAQRKYNTGY